MPYSMTGIGRASGEIQDPAIKLDVEIKSYNHRFLEISVKCPGPLQQFEDEIRRMVQKKVTRGHIVVVIQQDRDILSTTVEIDEALLRSYMKLAEELKNSYPIEGTLNINTLLAVSGLIKFSQPQAEAKNIFAEFKPILDKALDSFLDMKRKEGENIAKEVWESIDIVEKNIEAVEKLIPERNKDYEDHLSSVLDRYKGDVNEDRFYQELLYIADRTDVTEECKRLSSHLILFKETLKEDAHPGRKLTFLLQEMQREANTCSVKANFLEISKSIVFIKEEIEKIREQVQNLE